MKKRIDQYLVDNGLAPSTKIAQAMVLAGQVLRNTQKVRFPSEQVSEQDAIRVLTKGKYVSRGGDKLAAAIAEFALTQEFAGKTVLDIGSSTGGFTDCVLSLGASRAIAVDIGSNQLAWKLSQDPRVLLFEKTDIRQFALPTDTRLDWIVMDVSANRMVHLVETLKKLGLASKPRYLLLVKPQFETSHVPPGGVLTDEPLRNSIVAAATATLIAAGFEILGTFDSSVKGSAGNQETFLFTRLRVT